MVPSLTKTGARKQSQKTATAQNYGLAEDLIVEKQDGIERLILGAGRQITVARQVG